jgi:hypothetical protein
MKLKSFVGWIVLAGFASWLLWLITVMPSFNDQIAMQWERIPEPKNYNSLLTLGWVWIIADFIGLYIYSRMKGKP